MRNVAERASNYALMSALYERQIGDISTAQGHLNEAKKLDLITLTIAFKKIHVCRAR
jgi:hypothetical protein